MTHRDPFQTLPFCDSVILCELFTVLSNYEEEKGGRLPNIEGHLKLPL